MKLRRRTRRRLEFASLGLLGATVLAIVGGVTVSAIQGQAPAPIASKVAEFYEANKDLKVATPKAMPAVPKLTFSKGDPALFFGDSWTFGVSAEPVSSGFAYVAESALELDGDVRGGVGTGYVNPGKNGQGTYAERLAVLPAANPRLVVIQGSVNDFGKYIPEVDKAATAFVSAVQSKYPQAQVVMMGPATFTWPADPQVAQIDKVLAGVAAQKGINYVSPSAGGWITADNFPKVIDPATSHPSTEGHAYLGGKLAEALTKLKG